MPIEISLLGCGHPHVADLLGVIAAEPDLRLAAAWDADRSAVPGPLSSHAVYEADTAIARADAVVICAPTDQRPALRARAARAGRPVLVQSPIARTSSEARRLARQITGSRTPALAALFVRELPALAQLRGVIRAGVLGRWIGSPPDPGEALRAFAARLRTRSLPRAGLSDAIRAQETIERAAIAE
jgi:predicted dehydrogenase